MNAFAEHGDPNADRHCRWCGKKLAPRYRYIEPPRVWKWEPHQEFDRSGKMYVPDETKGQVCHTLDKVRYGEPTYGYNGDGAFCTATCGWMFARRMVQLGKRLKPGALDG